VKKLAFMALLGVAAFGVTAILAVLVATRDPAGGPASPARTASPDEAAVTWQAVPAAPGNPRAAARQEQLPEPGPPRLQLPDRILARDVTAPVAPCLLANPTNPGGGALLTLELEAQDGGGLLIVGAPVARWENASKALVDCARHVLEGRTIILGAYSPGERFQASYALESAVPEPAPPAPSTVPSRRPAQRGAAGAASRR
jgi:hypothetical protein